MLPTRKKCGKPLFGARYLTRDNAHGQPGKIAKRREMCIALFCNNSMHFLPLLSAVFLIQRKVFSHILDANPSVRAKNVNLDVANLNFRKNK